MRAPPPVNVFICHAPEDDALRIELDKHLAVLRREGHVKSFASCAVGPGEARRAALEREIDRADVILLLESADLLARDELADVEVGRALARHRAKRAQAFVILLRPCDDSGAAGPLAGLVRLPRDGRPVTRWPTLDEGLSHVATELRRLILAERAEPAPASTRPSAGPAAWSVPFSRNPNFTGRAEELARLAEGFASGATCQALSGLGGAGKTQIAIEYAHRHLAEYDAVWWLRADEPATLAADFADLADALRIPGLHGADPRAAGELVKGWLARHKRWLLIFDSAREPREIAPYLVPSGRGHVIVTSRHASFREVARALPIRGLRRADAVELLLRRSGARDGEGPAGALAEALGDLPLALAQAGAYMEETGTSASAYLALFQARQEEMLRRGAPDRAAPSVATTWELALAEAQASSPAAAELLALSAFLAPDDLPREVLAAGADILPPALAEAARDPLALDLAVAALRRYSLIEAQEGALSVHRLVQAVVRERLGEEARRAWAERAVRLVGRAFPEDPADPSVRAACRRLLPHARAACAHADATGAPPAEATSILLRKAAKHQHLGGFEADARGLFERALALAEAVHGPDHAHVAMILTGLALVLKELGDAAAARRAAERALGIDEALRGPRSAIVATDSINLASVLLDLGELAEARRRAELALAIDEALFGPSDPTVARDANNLGAILWRQGELDEARRHVERALRIDERNRRPDDPDLALHLNNLGFLRREMGDLEGARAHLERALAIGEAAFGPEDPRVATYCSNLASVLQQRGELAAARAHLERALSISEATHGPDHHSVAIRRNNLGLLLMDLGDLEGARKQLESAVAIAKRALGAGHRRVKKLENNLGAVLRALGRS